MENLNRSITEETPNELAEQWQNLGNESQTSSESKTLPLYSEVGYGGYKISSLPFDSKDEAYEEIRNSWQNVPEVTTHFYEGKWYIISKS